MTANAVASKFCGTAAATSAIISAKPIGALAAYQRWIVKAEQSGFQTLTVTGQLSNLFAV
jgi:hypothetical protein